MTLLIFTLLSPLVQQEMAQKASHDPGVMNVLLSAGVAGACLIACGIWIKIKDASYEKRIDQMLADKDKFIAQYIEMAGKYQAAMDKFATSLEVVVSLAKNQQATMDKFAASLEVITTLIKNQGNQRGS
jgi:hypothetical protein